MPIQRITPLSPVQPPHSSSSHLSGDIPLPRPRSRFYIPDSQPTSEPTHSQPTSLSSSSMNSPIRQRSRSSVTSLRAALQEYQIHPPDPTTESVSAPVTPPRMVSKDMVSSRSLTHFGHDGLPGDQMDALVEIHRVLYRGSEDTPTGERLSWDKQGEEVKRVVDRWFEGDCVYDHPLVRVSSRQSLLTHFILLNLLATMYIPSLTPATMMNYARLIARTLRDRVLGLEADRDVEAALISTADVKGKGKLRLEEEWFGLDPPFGEKSTFGPREVASIGKQDGWWKVWDVSADCREIGGMERYDGHHLALIDHVISLTLFPTIARPRQVGWQSSASSSISSIDITDSPGQKNSLAKNIAEIITTEVEGMLHWELPITTLVQFNEVGRATHVRDVIDVRDLIETFIPFARRLNWLTRRVTGLLTSSLGSLALAVLPLSTIHGKQPVPMSWEKSGPASSAFRPESVRPIAPIGLGMGSISRPTVIRTTTSERENLLGLEGMSMAPDVDRGGFPQSL